MSAQWMIASLTILMGVLAAGVGVVISLRAFQSARRLYRRTAALSTATPEGWGAWFLDGFSGMSLGIRWLYAVASLVVWALAGCVLIGLGIRLF